jgi:hypothetical protein
MGSVFNGKLDLKKFPYKKIKATNDKLSKINKKLQRRVEKFYKKKGIKPYKLADRVKLIDKKFKKTLGKKNIEMIESGQFKLDFAGLAEGTIGNQSYDSNLFGFDSGSSRSPASIAPKDKVSKEKEEIGNLLNTNDPQKRVRKGKKRFSDEELIAASKKKFKVNTIRKNKEVNIFKYVSEAYKRALPRLDQNVIKSHKASDKINAAENEYKKQMNESSKQSLLLSY